MHVTRATADYVSPKDNGVCAEFSIVLDDELCIHRVKVINGKNGLFVAFPNSGCRGKNTSEKRYRDLVHPTSDSLRQIIQNEVLSEYNKRLLNS